jgi:hypothetical protein
MIMQRCHFRRKIGLSRSPNPIHFNHPAIQDSGTQHLAKIGPTPWLKGSPRHLCAHSVRSPTSACTNTRQCGVPAWINPSVPQEPNQQFHSIHFSPKPPSNPPTIMPHSSSHLIVRMKTILTELCPPTHLKSPLELTSNPPTITPYNLTRLTTKQALSCPPHLAIRPDPEQPHSSVYLLHNRLING